MKFYVEFTTKMITATAINLETRRNGTRAIERVRTELNIPNLDPELIWEKTRSWYVNIEIQVPYETALRCSHFENTNLVTVRVDIGALNQFVYEELEVIRSTETGEVLDVQFIRKLDENQVIYWWEQNEFKLDLRQQI